MATVDPATLARAKAQIESHPLFAQYVAGHGRAQGGGALDPRMFGVDYLPKDYLYSLGARRLVDQTDWADKAAMIGSLAIMSAGVPLLFAGPAAAVAPTGAAGAATPSFGSAAGAEIGSINTTGLFAPNALVGTGTGVAAGGASAASAAGAAASGLSVADRIKQLAKDPATIAKVAASVPLFTSAFGGAGGGENGALGEGSALMNEIQQSLAMQRKRTQQAQPVYDALVNQAYARTPTRYRGAAPEGYPSGADAAPAGAYAYTPPRFG